MKRSTKLLLGLATMWLPIYLVLFMAFVFGMIFFADSNASSTPPTSPPPVESVEGDRESGAMPVIATMGIVGVFALHTFTIFLSIGLTIFYIIHAIKNEALKSDAKAIWAVLFFMAGMVAQPIYWYMQIWKDPGAAAPPSNRTEWGTGTEPPDWR
jgi:hypothetical protein